MVRGNRVDIPQLLQNKWRRL